LSSHFLGLKKGGKSSQERLQRLIITKPPRINMLVSEFMVPAGAAITCSPTDTIESVLNQLLENSISAVVVVDLSRIPVGIVTKTDLVQAFKDKIPIDSYVDAVMTTSIKTVKGVASRDEAAGIFDENRIHHVIVVGEELEFAGIISSLDIARETSLDGKAWPWNRQAAWPWKRHDGGVTRTSDGLAPS
jgi:CBS domain-containing protein